MDILLPVITKIINYSLEHGVFPSAWKNALVFPLLKKDGLGPIFKNYRPVSNLQFISKLAESAVAKQLQHHISTNNLFHMLQSSYRKFHSTESALLKVKNDILLIMNGQQVTLLVLLDLSAAFDTIDHGILHCAKSQIFAPEFARIRTGRRRVYSNVLTYSIPADSKCTWSILFESGLFFPYSN